MPAAPATHRPRVSDPTSAAPMGARPARFAIPPGLRDMMVASLLFALMSVMVKEVERHLPVGYAVFARSAIGLGLSLWLVRRAGLSWRGNRPGLLAVRGLVGFSALMCTFESISRIALSDAIILQQTQPLWTTILAWLFLGEPLRPRVALAMAVALAGVALVVRPPFLFGGAAHDIDPAGVALALAAAVLSAGAYVSVRALRKTDHTLVVVLWFALIATPFSVPSVLVELVPPRPIDLLLLLGIGVTVQGAQMLMTRALHREPAGRVVAVGYLQVVYASLFGVVFFGETLTPLGLGGAALIIAGALIATFDARAAMSRLTPRGASDTNRAH